MLHRLLLVLLDNSLTRLHFFFFSFLFIFDLFLFSPSLPSVSIESQLSLPFPPARKQYRFDSGGVCQSSTHPRLSFPPPVFVARPFLYAVHVPRVFKALYSYPVLSIRNK